MKKLMITLLLVVLLVGTVSAFEFDNRKEFVKSGKYGKVHIDNVFGLGSRLATVELKENTDFCAEDCEAILEIQTFSPSRNSLGGLRLRQKKVEGWDEDADSQNLKVYLQTGTENVYVDKWEDVCSLQMRDGQTQNVCVPTKAGKKKVKQPVWTLWDGDRLPVGRNKIKITGTKEAHETLDWVPTFLGEEVTEWAEWSGYADGVDKEFFYRLNEGTGTDVGDAFGSQNGIFNAAPTWEDSDWGAGYGNQTRGTGDTTYFNNSFNINGTTSWTLEFRINVSSEIDDYVMTTGADFGAACSGSTEGILLHRPASNLDFSTCDGSTYNTASPSVSSNQIYHFVWVYERNNCGIYQDGVLVSNYSTCAVGTAADGSSSENMMWFNRWGSKSGKGFLGGIDQIVFWNRSLTGAEILSANSSTGDGSGATPAGTIGVNMTLELPLNQTSTTNDSINFTVNMIPENSNMTNATLRLWNSTNDLVNETTNTVTGNESVNSTWDVQGLAQDVYHWNALSCAENSTASSCFMAEANSSLTIDSVVPEIFVNQPRDVITLFETSGSQELNFTLTEPNEDTCFYDYNNVNTTIASCANTTFTPVSGVTVLRVFVNDTSGTTNFNETEWSYLMFEENSSSNSSVFETDLQNIAINVTKNESIITLVGNLWYNGTRQTTTNTCSGNSCVMSSDLDIPTITAQTTKNYFWELISTNQTDTIYTNLSTQTQEINRTLLTNCPVTDGNLTANFSIYNFSDQAVRINATFAASFEFWLGTGSVKQNNTFQNTTEGVGDHLFCMEPINRTLNVDADINFDSESSGNNFHYLRSVEFNNIISHINLYLLDDGLATLTTLQVVNDLQQGLPNRTIQVDLHNIGDNSFTTVTMAKTNYEGEDIVYLNWFDSEYRFVILENGTVINSIEPFKVSKTPQVFLIQDTGQFSQDKFRSVTNNLFFDNETGDFVLSFNDPDNQISAGCLQVIRVTPNNFTILSDQCLSATSGTLTYNIGVNATGTYNAIFYAAGSPRSIIDRIMYVNNFIGSIYEQIGNLDGTTITVFMVGTMALLGLLAGVPGVIFMTVLGLFVSNILGFMNPNLISIVAVMGIVGGYIIWVTK